MSPTLMSLNFSTFRPHSRPFLTSFASSLKRLVVELAGVDHDALADDADAVVPVDGAVGHEAAGNRAHLGDFEGLADLGRTGDALLDLADSRPSMASFISSMTGR